MERLFDFKAAQRKWNGEWEKSRLFEGKAPSSGESFVIVLPPPNVTGILTVGHILGNTIQDVLIRWKRMSGHNVLWIPGTDHAGIATQKVVEDELEKAGRTRSSMSREEFVEQCWEWKECYHERIVEQLKALGCALDWSRECFTMDEERSAAVRRVFVHLYEKGLIYQGDYIVNWCPVCGTAVSDEEVIHEEVDAFLYWIRYGLEDGSHLTVATTRPETVLGDTAVAVNPDDEGKRERVGKNAILPLVGRKLPIVADKAVDAGFGSGYVKVTPAHDPNDFFIAERHKLPLVVVIDRAGRMTSEAGENFSGLDRFACREKILQALKKEGFLEKVEPYRHAIGHHDRCKTVIEPLLSKEWFVKMEPLAKPAIECVERGEIDFYPPRWRNVYLSWMRNIRDWCISRQLWWGHRIPVWYCSQGHRNVSTEDPKECTTCGRVGLHQDESVLDTWFSSWLWTFSPLGWPEQTEDLRAFHPTSVLVTGSDIIFFWVARMIMASLEFLNEVPFRHVLLTGIVRDTRGRKMSKSLGNSPDPLAIIEKYGSDAFRFTMVMLSPAGHDVYFSEEKVEIGRNFVNKIWQASRMVIGSFEQYGSSLLEGEEGNGKEDLVRAWQDEFSAALGFEPRLEWEDRWILSELARCVEGVEEKLRSWKINEAAVRIYEFFWHEYCDWYLELAKIRLRRGGDGRTPLSVLLFVLAETLKLLHPFIPYVTDELWARLPMTDGFLLDQGYPEPEGSLRDRASEEDMRIFKELVTQARNIRARYRISPSARITLFVKTPAGGERTLEKMAAGLEELTGAGSFSYGPGVEKERGSASVPVGNYEVIIPLAGVMDLEEEVKRLTKERDKLEAALASVEKKLSNQGFLAKAKAEVVRRERERKALLETELFKVKESLDIIQEHR